MAALSFTDDGYLATYWMDFRVDPFNDTLYDWRRGMTRSSAGASSRVLAYPESLGWPASFPVPTIAPMFFALGCPRLYGDVDTVASPHLHSHSAHAFFNLAGQETITTITSSPRDPPQ